MRPRAEGALNRQWIVTRRDDKNSSCPIQSPDILDQLKPAPATKRQSKAHHPRLMFGKHFSACWRIIGFIANSKAACRFNQCNQPGADERCMMDDEHLDHCLDFHRGTNRGLFSTVINWPMVAAGRNNGLSLSKRECLHGSISCTNFVSNMPT